jgi:hypothetical protein
MAKVRMLVGLALVLTMGVCQGETLLDVDFTKPDPKGFVIAAVDGNAAQLLDPKTSGVTQVLSLTQNKGGQQGIVWTELKRQVPSFSYIADIRVRWAPVDDEGNEVNPCPADGMALAFADVGIDAAGTAGGNLGLFNNPDVIGRFIALDINTWYGQGLGLGTGDAAGEAAENCQAAYQGGETISFANMKPDFEGAQEDPDTGRSGYDRHSNQGYKGDPAKGGHKLGITRLPQGMKIVNGGLYRYHWNVDSATNTMTVYITGLDDSNKQFQKVKVTEIKSGKPVLDFQGRWGITAATGGAVQYTEVFRVRIDSPMIEPL